MWGASSSVQQETFRTQRPVSSFDVQDVSAEMHDHFDDKYFYFQGETSARGTSEWSHTPRASTPMTRLSSEESAYTAYGDMVRTPNSGYGTYGVLWPSASVPQGNNILWSPMPDSGHEVNYLPTNYDPSYVVDNSGYATTSNGSHGNTTRNSDNWWESCHSVADAELDQKHYWSMKAPSAPTHQFPTIVSNEGYSTTPQFSTKESVFECLAEGCTKSFKRKADLERHYKNLHTQSECKDQFPCDWKKCQRAKHPFHRVDHQREHYREFHHEDIMRRGSSGKQNRGWWSSRVVNPCWWRCSRCLCRVSIDEYGYECSECKTSCERERIAHRSSLRSL